MWRFARLELSARARTHEFSLIADIRFVAHCRPQAGRGVLSESEQLPHAILPDSGERMESWSVCRRDVRFFIVAASGGRFQLLL
jgi:hypothetical protein